MPKAGGFVNVRFVIVYYLLIISVFINIVFIMGFQQNYDQDLPYIPYNSSNKNYARFNRKNQTKAESLMRNIVLKWNKTWYRFVRQKTLWWFIADFYCSKLLFVVEIDWWYHDETQEEDENRDIRMKSKWIKTIRFTNDEIEKNLEWVIQYLEDIIMDREKELWL
jgi:very-short-patch-repair endonuclease